LVTSNNLTCISGLMQAEIYHPFSTPYSNNAKTPWRQLARAANRVSKLSH
jgi:hypothetical protein